MSQAELIARILLLAAERELDVIDPPIEVEREAVWRFAQLLLSGHREPGLTVIQGGKDAREDGSNPIR